MKSCWSKHKGSVIGKIVQSTFSIWHFRFFSWPKKCFTKHRCMLTMPSDLNRKDLPSNPAVMFVSECSSIFVAHYVRYEPLIWGSVANKAVLERVRRKIREDVVTRCSPFVATYLRFSSSRKAKGCNRSGFEALHSARPNCLSLTSAGCGLDPMRVIFHLLWLWRKGRFRQILFPAESFRFKHLNLLVSQS